MAQSPLRTGPEALASPGSRLSREFSASKHLESGLERTGRSLGKAHLLGPAFWYELCKLQTTKEKTNTFDYIKMENLWILKTNQ